MAGTEKEVWVHTLLRSMPCPFVTPLPQVAPQHNQPSYPSINLLHSIIQGNGASRIFLPKPLSEMLDSLFGGLYLSLRPEEETCRW